MAFRVKYGADKETDRKMAREEIALRALDGKIKIKQGKRINYIKEKEYFFILDNYKKMPIEKIAKTLGKTVNTIKGIAGYFNLNCVYLENDEIIYNQFIKLLCCDNSDSYQEFILKRYGAPIYKKNNWKVINIPQFLSWLEEHKKLLNLHNYELGSLGKYEQPWIRKKAILDKLAWEYLNKRSWSDDDDAWLEIMVKEGMTYEQISKKLKRTGSAIKRRCYDLNLPKPKRLPPKLWSRYELKKLKDLWLEGYEPILIAEKLRNRSDRMIISMLERFEYFGQPPEKFNMENMYDKDI